MAREGRPSSNTGHLEGSTKLELVVVSRSSMLKRELTAASCQYKDFVHCYYHYYALANQRSATDRSLFLEL